MQKSDLTAPPLAALEIPLERDLFLRMLIRELTGTLQAVVGLEEAAGFISIVGQTIGQWLNQEYQTALNSPSLTREQVAEVLVDLKRRIQGDFYLISQDEQQLVFGNRTCPFAEKVLGRPALCMMTSNVFGAIAAENLGYGRVELQETIALGHGRCTVVVHLQPGAPDIAHLGREYFQTGVTG